MQKKAFTLIEIIVTIIIIGAMASFALPRFNNAVETTKSAEGKQILLSLLNAQKIHYLEKGAYTTDLGELDVSIPGSTNFRNILLRTSDPIATIERNTLYILKIYLDGSFTCEDRTAGSCEKIGLPST